MQIDFDQISPRQASKLLVATVVPRPIALVTSLDTTGRRNAAPFSFFNCMSSDPPLLVIGLENRGPGTHKDTFANIRATGEYVVHLVDEALAPAMNIMATDFGPEVDEIAEAGVTAVPAAHVSAPRIAEAPVAFECRSRQWVDLGDGRCIEIGEVIAMHIRDDAVNLDRFHVDTAALNLIARMQNPGWYARTSDQFQLRRLSVESWAEIKATTTRTTP